MSATHFTGPVIAKGHSVQTVQAEAELDLTTTDNSVGLLIQEDDIGSGNGSDTVIPVRVHGLVTEDLASDNQNPVVTVRDSNGNDAGASVTFSTPDNYDVDDYFLSEVSDDTAMTPIDLTSEDAELVVTTSADDTSTAAGKIKAVVDLLLIK